MRGRGGNVNNVILSGYLPEDDLIDHLFGKSRQANGVSLKTEENQLLIIGDKFIVKV